MPALALSFSATVPAVGCSLEPVGRAGVDGRFTSKTIISLQRFLNQHWAVAGFRLKQLDEDGDFSAASVRALQTFLNSHTTETEITVDGEFNRSTIEALQKFLNRHWRLAGFRQQKLAVDGNPKNGFGASSVKALQTYLIRASSSSKSRSNLCVCEGSTEQVRLPI